MRYAGVTAALLLIPFLGNWDWSGGDNVIMGILIFGTGLAYELVTWKIADRKRKIVHGIIFLILFLLTWAELAVGIFGTPFAGN